MTQAQEKLTTETLKELKQLAPSVEWHVTWNYYSKLPEFTAIKDGGVKFDMWKRERREIVTQANGIKYPRYTGEKYVELSATVDRTTKDNGNGLIVSGAHNFDALPKSNIKVEIPRIDFKKYLQFIKDNLGILEQIGA
jgi:hypothetical protein